MNEEVIPADETVELDAERWILLSFNRQWPRYVVEWSIRRRQGDSDYPLARGEVGALPRAAGTEAIWSDLREQALTAAQAAVPPEPEERKSFFGRLFGRG